MNNISDYALIGDCHSVALVGRDGSIDWACFPRFDADAQFCRILDPDAGGYFSITVPGSRPLDRAYIEDTNVLVTRLERDGGILEITDCMPVEPFDPSKPTHVKKKHSILRRIRCAAGRMDAHAIVSPRFEFGLFLPRFRQTGPYSGDIIGGPDAMYVHATRELADTEETIQGEWDLAEGEEAWIEVAWAPSHAPVEADPSGDPRWFSDRLDETIAFWRDWLKKCWYEGDHKEAVFRSALVLKALTYAPTGAVIAAPTTSLPEQIGGIRNWDYRYTWIRDATLTLTSLFVLGFREEADDFKFWLERTGAGRPEDFQIMYGICGERSLPERELDHLAGHKGSAPVRTGNGAAKQMQLDAYGQILEAAYLYSKAGGEFSPDNWRFLTGLVEIVCERWRSPDQGIWEIRDEPRHFVHSKLNCWVALDRGVKLASYLAQESHAVRWAAERDEIRDYLMTQAAPDGWFHQAIGMPDVDAATLLVPALGFLPTNHPLVRATIDKVERELGSDGFVHRYCTSDGLEGGEGAFLLCSFWLLDCLTHAGRIEEAEALLDRLLSLSNDVGLFGEEVDPTTGEALGNFPQAFTHMALVLSCAHLSAAKRGLVPPDGAHDYAELALDRLLSALTRAGGQPP